MKAHLKHLASLKRKTCKEIIYLKRKEERMNDALLWKKRQNGLQCIQLRICSQNQAPNKICLAKHNIAPWQASKVMLDLLVP
jgi:hypothetical protein